MGMSTAYLLPWPKIARRRLFIWFYFWRNFFISAIWPVKIAYQEGVRNRRRELNTYRSLTGLIPDNKEFLHRFLIVDEI